MNASATSAEAGRGGALRAAQLLADGDARGALLSASEACHNAPGLAEPHYVYGQAWAALGEHARAEQAFAATLQRAPAWADAWIEYGLARYRQGALADAIAAMRQALHHAPAHPAAAANLGAFLRITGESEAAEAVLRASLSQAPEAAGARLNLAADLLQEERAAEALALLDAVERPTEPDIARHLHLQRSLALLQFGRAAEARAALTAFDALGPAPPALRPLRLWRAVLLAQAEGRAQEAETAAVAMEEALGQMGPTGVPEHRIRAHYDLAKFRSARGEPARAFAHWREGHRLLAASQPFSREAHLAFIEANIASFSAARFAAGPRAGNRDPAPVFIVGMPRSGTTLCERILAAHRDVHGAGERPALERQFAQLGGLDAAAAPARLAALGAADLDGAAEGYLAEMHALALGKARIVDKMPGNALYLGLAGLMLPGAKVIHCTRDPRDTGLSIFTFRFHGEHGYAHDLADLGWTIRQRDRLMAHWRAALPLPVLRVGLADWVTDFEGTLARVLAHLDLPPDPACARFHEVQAPVRTVSRAQVQQPINAHGLGRWRAYAAELAPLIAELEADPA